VVIGLTANLTLLSRWHLIGSISREITILPMLFHFQTAHLKIDLSTVFNPLFWRNIHPRVVSLSSCEPGAKFSGEFPPKITFPLLAVIRLIALDHAICTQHQFRIGES
jgi:hypothetical protein